MMMMVEHFLGYFSRPFLLQRVGSGDETIDRSELNITEACMVLLGIATPIINTTQ